MVPAWTSAAAHVAWAMAPESVPEAEDFGIAGSPFGPGPVGRRSGGVGDQAFAGELLAGLGERQVGRREGVLRGLEGVGVERLRLGADDGGQVLAGGGEAVLVARLDRPDDRVVELVEAGVEAVVQAVLSLVGDADDHACPPSPSCLASPPCEPGFSSAFIFASSSSTSLEELSCAGWRFLSSLPGPGAGRAAER